MLATFLILFNTLLFKYFSLNVYFEGIRILPINSIIWRHDDVILRHWVNQVIPKVGNDKYIFLCNFGGHSMSGFEVIAGGLWSPSPVAGSEKKSPVWIGLNIQYLFTTVHCKPPLCMVHEDNYNLTLYELQWYFCEKFYPRSHFISIWSMIVRVSADLSRTLSTTVLLRTSLTQTIMPFILK